MKTRTHTLRQSLGLAMPMLLLAAIAISAQMDGRLAQTQQQNAEALWNYEWKSRTEIIKGDDSKKTRVTAMRYDAAGNLQKTIISETPDEDIPSFGLIGRIAHKKKKEFLKKVEGLGALARSYGELPAENMQRLMTTASFTPTEQNLLRVEGRNVLQAGDSMVVFLDASSRRQRRVEIQTTFDEKPVRIVSEFQDLPQGPTYMARSRVSYDGTSIVIVTENFDYRRIQTK